MSSEEESPYSDTEEFNSEASYGTKESETEGTPQEEEERKKRRKERRAEYLRNLIEKAQERSIGEDESKGAYVSSFYRDIFGRPNKKYWEGNYTKIERKNCIKHFRRPGNIKKQPPSVPSYWKNQINKSAADIYEKELYGIQRRNGDLWGALHSWCKYLLDKIGEDITVHYFATACVNILSANQADLSRIRRKNIINSVAGKKGNHDLVALKGDGERLLTERHLEEAAIITDTNDFIKEARHRSGNNNNSFRGRGRNNHGRKNFRGGGGKREDSQPSTESKTQNPSAKN